MSFWMLYFLRETEDTNIKREVESRPHRWGHVAQDSREYGEMVDKVGGQESNTECGGVREFSGCNLTGEHWLVKSCFFLN